MTTHESRRRRLESELYGWGHTLRTEDLGPEAQDRVRRRAHVLLARVPEKETVPAGAFQPLAVRVAAALVLAVAVAFGLLRAAGPDAASVEATLPVRERAVAYGRASIRRDLEQFAHRHALASPRPIGLEEQTDLLLRRVERLEEDLESELKEIGPAAGGAHRVPKPGRTPDWRLPS